jgi:hypothetical protein
VRTLPLDVRPPAGARPEEVACQYLAFTRADRDPRDALLAASSDGLRTVFVWRVHTAQAVWRSALHARPTLALAFLPPLRPGDGSAVLAWTEDRRRVRLADVATAAAAGHRADGDGMSGSRGGGRLAAPDMQTLRMPRPRTAGGGGAGALSRRINGLDVAEDGSLLVATTGQLLEYPRPPAWSPDAHGFYPPRFKAAVRTLLLAAGAREQPSRAAAAAGPSSSRAAAAAAAAAGGRKPALASLPEDVLGLILGAAATPLARWAAAPAPRAAAPPGRPQAPSTVAGRSSRAARRSAAARKSAAAP